MVCEKSGRVGVANEKMRGMLWRGKHKEFAIAMVMACAGLLPGIVLSTGIVAAIRSLAAGGADFQSESRASRTRISNEKAEVGS